MVGYQEKLDFHLKMSRKELQKLCKQHDLPANRSHAQLAKSLASLFKNKNAGLAASVEKSGPSVDGSFKKSFVSESNAKQTVNPLEESTEGVCGKPNSSNVDIHGWISGINEIQGDDRSLCQTGNQTEAGGHTVNLALEKPQAAINVYPSLHANNKGTEGFGSSTSENCNMGIRSCFTADIQGITTNQLLGLESKEKGIQSESRKLLEPIISEQNLIHDAVRNIRTCNTAPVRCEHSRPREYSMESGFVSAGEISIRTPSLQFFVMSQGGINLYVDLNSSPLEWINILKDEVCIHQNTEHDESRILSKDISDSPEVVDHMKNSPSVGTGMDLQGVGVEQNTGCTNSSLNSVVSENCNSEAYPPETTVVTSGSSVLTSGSLPAGLSGCLEENQVVSSSCAAHSAQNHQASDIAACPQEGTGLIQDTIDASFAVVKSNASLPDNSMKSVANKDNDAMNPVTIDGSTPKTACVSFNALSHVLNDIPDENKLPMSKDIQDSTDTYHFDHLKNHSGACEGSSVPCMNELPDNAGRHGGLSSSCQLNEQMVLDGPMADAQSEVGAADGLFYQQACSNCATLVTEDPMSTFRDESGQSTPMRGKDTSECSRVQTTLENSSKRSNNLDFPKEFHVKRQHVCGENTNGTNMNLKSTKNSAKEAPRRSTRLVAK